jgi:hypothetical protein
MAPNSFKQSQFDKEEFALEEKVSNGGHENGGNSIAEGSASKDEGKGEEKKPPTLPPVGVGELFKYADKLDTVLIIGTIRIKFVKRK